MLTGKEWSWEKYLRIGRRLMRYWSLWTSFRIFTDGEDKEVSKDDASGDLEESLVLGNTEGLESTTTAGEKKAGARKQLFSIAAGGNNMKKFAQVLHSPRKRTTVKQGVRKGGGAKQAEEKGPSHPKQPKP
ncbi:hypothetical protein Bca4012_075657 [Brassica carinata]|uniref:Uncharacterized protein n=1 Tax=Brassica carinata TaxID=52824 RepID=A0A8X7QCK4_BRACI|nr:hypothetical protein Bca52824_073941 [Brassica carinata]